MDSSIFFVPLDSSTAYAQMNDDGKRGNSSSKIIDVSSTVPVRLTSHTSMSRAVWFGLVAMLLLLCINCVSIIGTIIDTQLKYFEILTATCESVGVALLLDCLLILQDMIILFSSRNRTFNKLNRLISMLVYQLLFSNMYVQCKLDVLGFQSWSSEGSLLFYVHLILNTYIYQIPLTLWYIVSLVIE